MTTLQQPTKIINSILRLRDDMAQRVQFNQDEHAQEMLTKLNACLYDNYPQIPKPEYVQ